MFGSKLQLYLLIGAAFILGLLGIYSSGIARGQDKIKRKMDQKLIDDMRLAKGVDDEINSMDDDSLGKLANKWLREDNK
tara:strand:+ start:1900 stop:2136 length:237 start_codon:yes stop_codon:yes gene_type:complete